ncbi:alpha/beta fold hydrolase [Phytohabitans sp. LJ34]|uniref:alpha/beta fold hydrolase n=1 Tax=Phytohabitans sp. LJ34 TaxID=3452217 RepID=UPI003F8AE49A
MKRALLGADDIFPADRETPRWPGRTEMLDGSRVFVRDTPATSPAAEPALYVHGLGGSSTNWTDLSGLLASRLEGQAIDLPGFGRSDPARRYTIAAFADRVIRWIEHSDRGPVHLFGNSLGGAISVRVAGTRPDLVRSLTLVSPAMPFLDPRRSSQSRVLPLLAIPRGDRLALRFLGRITPEEMARQIIATCFADPERVSEQRRLEAIEEIRIRYELAHYVPAYLGSLRGLVSSFLRAYLPGEGSLWRIASRITAPTLVIGGRQDQLVDIRVPPQVARTIPDSRLLILDQVGHVAQMEVPRMVARAAVALLDEIRQPASSSTPRLSRAVRPARVAPA